MTVMNPDEAIELNRLFRSGLRGATAGSGGGELGGAEGSYGGGNGGGDGNGYGRGGYGFANAAVAAVGRGGGGVGSITGSGDGGWGSLGGGFVGGGFMAGRGAGRADDDVATIGAAWRNSAGQGNAAMERFPLATSGSASASAVDKSLTEIDEDGEEEEECEEVELGDGGDDIESILDPSEKKCKPKAEDGESSEDEPTGSEALAAEVDFPFG